MISREKTSIRKYKKRETLSLSISLPAQRILLKIWEMFSNAINNTLLKNKNFRRWSRKNWSFFNGMTHPTGTRHPNDVPCTYRGMYLSSYKRYDPCTSLGWTDLDKNSNISSTRNVYTKDVRDSYTLYIPRMYERVVSSMYKYVS